MKQVLLCCLTAVVSILCVCSKGIHGRPGGSKMCPDLSLQSLPVVSSRHLQLHILSSRSGDSFNPSRHCSVISVKFVPGSDGESLSKYSLSQLWFVKKDNNRLKLAVRNQITINAKVIVELNCKGKSCFLLSSVNRQANDKWKRYKRKLLSLKSIPRMNNDHNSTHVFVVWMAVGAVLTLVVVLAMCACHKNNVEKTLRDEVGGTEFNQQVIGVSSINKPQQESQTIKGTNTTNSTKDSKTIATQEKNGSRTASQSSHQHEGTVERTSYLESSNNQSSINGEKTLEIESETHENNERIRSQSTKEQTSQPSESVDLRGFSQSDTFMYKGNEANIATPSHDRKQPVQLISRKDSDKKETKDHDGNQKVKRSWLRRKSSKTKSTSENQTPKTDKKTNSRHSDLPLPPTPEGKNPPTFIEEENQYEAVETRPKRVEKMAERNIKEDSRQSSELYASIDEDKAKRNSSGSHMYDVVETKQKPTTDNSSGLEYAYTVVAPKDNPIQPSQTSSGSGLYEVVTEDMKKNIPLVQVENDYAIVQKDSSKKKSSTANQTTRPLSDTDLAPAPPPVTVMPSVKRRTQSEGENLNVLADKPSATMLGEPKKEVEHTYAKVNKLRKTSKTNRNAESTLTQVADDESEEPPPIPPSLYAELPVKGDEELVSDGKHEENMTTIIVDSMSTSTNEISITSMNSTKTVVVESETHIQRNSLSDVKVLCDVTEEVLQEPLHSGKLISDDVPNPLYDEIHYV